MAPCSHPILARAPLVVILALVDPTHHPNNTRGLPNPLPRDHLTVNIPILIPSILLIPTMAMLIPTHNT